MIRARQLLVLILATAVATACSAPPAATNPGNRGGGQAGASPGVAASPRLEDAVQSFFTNHYARAESQFRAFTRANPRSAEGHARLALFLNYIHHYAEATTESAAALAADSGNPLALAVRVRVLDWSANNRDGLVAAAAAGATAVRKAPASALAHAFYGEALADTQAVTPAKAELDQAAGLAQDAYQKAEVERERANLARDTGDKASELTHLLAARDRQPGWAERTRELGDYYYGVGQLDQATKVFHEAISLNPDDADLRTSIGDVALLREDVATADEAYGAANRLRPHDAALETVYAVTEFALKHDAAITETLLRGALADAPNSLETADLLQGFLRYVKGDAAAAADVTLGRQTSEPQRPGQRQPLDLDAYHDQVARAALKTVNDYRARAHLPAVSLDDRITAGAASHAYWFLFNLALTQVKGLGIHHEVAGTPGFTGFSMRDRATHFGYPNASMSEDITHRGSAPGAVQDWVDSVFHRFPIMRPDLVAIGFGAADVGMLPVEVMDMAYSAGNGDPRAMVPYPASGQADVPTSFYGNELPDPVPKGGVYPVGYPVTVNFSPSSRVAISDYRVAGPGGATLPVYTIEPTLAGSENVLSMLPEKPLQAHTAYSAHVSGTIDGTPFALDWSFTTGT
ncbi:MAG: CAP domain-containing protein [Candidatus Dormibacteria bacterium]